MANKVKFGFSKVTVWPIETEGPEVTYGKKIELNGGVSMKADPKGESNPFYADNKVYYLTQGSTSYDIDVEVALVPDEFLIQCGGLVKDKNGAIVEKNTAAKKKSFVLACEIDGDDKGHRLIFYHCTSEKLAIEAKTLADKTEVNTEVLKVKASADALGNVRAKITSEVVGYDTFFDNPYKVTEVGVG